MSRKSHARCEAGENLEIISKGYLSLFVDWCYKTAGVGDMLSAGGTGWQWGQSYAITADQLKPGDLVFKNPGSWSDNHVGLYLGTDANGNMLFMHCAGSSGVVINSYSGFKYFRRVPALDG